MDDKEYIQLLELKANNLARQLDESNKRIKGYQTELKLMGEIRDRLVEESAGRLELLREANKWLYVYSQYVYSDVVNHTRLKEFMDRIEAELGDD